jgi:phosphohistidine phosphatase
MVLTVRLYLVQHGQAKSEREDPERPLSSQGTDEVGRVARLAVEVAGVRPARVLHSGKTRARQTAEMWAGLLGVGVQEADGLAPNDDPARWAERLGPSSDDLMLVGHLPHLGRLSAVLLIGSPDPSLVRFRPGGLVGLDQADTGWVVWLVVPPDAT